MGNFIISVSQILEQYNPFVGQKRCKDVDNKTKHRMVQSRIDLLTLLVTRIRLGGGLLDPEAISANCDLFWTHWTFIDRYIGVHE